MSEELRARAELSDFASLMVDEVIARVRVELDAGQGLTLDDQRHMLNQLITERRRLSAAEMKREREEVKVADDAVNFVFDQLAEKLGLAEWQVVEGSEEWHGDVSATLHRLLTDAGIIDDETGAIASLSFASSAAGQREGWKPIETAPDDALLLLLWEPHDMGGFAFVGTRQRSEGVWYNNLDLKVQNPTLWMRFPDPIDAASPSAPEERRDEVATFLADLSSGKLVREVLAAGAIIDVMTGGKFDWRSRINDSDFTESADWMTALAYARAALTPVPGER